jgi:hypothetical protein
MRGLTTHELSLRVSYAHRCLDRMLLSADPDGGVRTDDDDEEGEFAEGAPGVREDWVEEDWVEEDSAAWEQIAGDAGGGDGAAGAAASVREMLESLLGAHAERVGIAEEGSDAD